MVPGDTTWVEDVRKASSIPELTVLYEKYGGAGNGAEFTQVFAWRKQELLGTTGGVHLSSFAGAIEKVFADWDEANRAMKEHGHKWAAADATVKKLQGKKFLLYRSQGGAIADAEARLNDDDELFQARMDRNLNEALMKSDYKVIELLEARFQYLQSLMVTERGDKMPTMERGGQ
jgi:hypothetical protein